MQCLLCYEFVYLEKEEKVTNAEANKEVSPDQESTKSESPLPQQQQQQTVGKDASRPVRKRKKVMRSKTFMNDEGYMGRCPVLTWQDDSFGRLWTNIFVVRERD